MKRKYRRAIIIVLINIIIILLVNDALLYWLDPLGVVDAMHENHDRHKHLINHPTGYAIEPGTHSWHFYDVTILEDFSRYVPDTNVNADCTIATIGDSVTFGFGVNDSETWVNLLAREYPTVHFINPARGDYSAANIALLKADTRANGYIWLIIGNDAETPYIYSGVLPSYWYPPATKIYLHWLTNRNKPLINRESDNAIYWQSVGQIITDNIIVFGFNNDPLAIETSEVYNVHLIDAWTTNVSFVDGHPNVQGHQQIAESLNPSVTRFIAQQCAD